ncbi:MAG: exo-alpha-sialidase [Clostridia bacterium]|nr:exo-alpha-sialidase [Clostridia bacterium]
MKKNNLFIKALSLILASLFLLTAFSACSNSNEKPEEEKKEGLDISAYIIVRKDASDKRITSETANLKKTIESTLDVALTVGTDWYNPSSAPDPNAKEILIDKTNRKESEEALAKLEGMPKDSFVIDITENKIVIVGKSTIGTVRAMKTFVNNYVLPSKYAGMIDISAGMTLTKEYDVLQNIYIEDKLDIDVEVVSTIIQSTRPGEYTDVLGTPATIYYPTYPSIVELQYQENEEDNGKLVAILEFSSSNDNSTWGSVWESTDKGESWKIIARPRETLDRTIKGISMAHIYELPAAVGDMPAGTLLYSGTSVDYSRRSQIAIWRSFDAGHTWKEYTMVASAGGLKEGIWEPFTWYDESDGYLYCFYSDDSDPRHDQKLVYKRSKDGKTWSDVCHVCAFDNPADRPGMLAMTKMGNGEYFAVYEYCGSENCHIYYKTTKDITSWNPSDPGTKLKAGGYSVGSAPWCVWTSAGGECGTLIVTGMWESGGDGTHRMFVSFDYGKTWETMTNPLPYDLGNEATEHDHIGYSPSLFVGADRSVIYYLNTTNTNDPKYAVAEIKFARLKLYEQ